MSECLPNTWYENTIENRGQLKNGEMYAYEYILFGKRIMMIGRFGCYARGIGFWGTSPHTCREVCHEIDERSIAPITHFMWLQSPTGLVGE